MKSIIIIIDYFGGKWPEWFPLFLESCRYNPTINWLFHTDCPCSPCSIKNVEFNYITKDDYIKYVNNKLDVRFDPADYYKICDLRPMYGVLYEEQITAYDFWGYGDLDVIYGNIRHFYTDKVLENNIISTHSWCISGHFALIKNEEWLKNAYLKIKNWKRIIEMKNNQRFDEDIFTKLFKYPKGLPVGLQQLYDFLYPSSKMFRTNSFFKEQYTTPLVPYPWKTGNMKHPLVWFWKDGRITNELDGDEEFIYLHFMNFKHARYLDPVYGKKAFWCDLPRLVNINSDNFIKGIRIDRYGFHEIS
ncbi:DUF6625 family protein [Bacteroidota bacterium]